MKSEGQQEMIEPVLRPARVKTKASNVDLSKPIEIHLITTVHMRNPLCDGADQWPRF